LAITELQSKLLAASNSSKKVKFDFSVDPAVVNADFSFPMVDGHCCIADFKTVTLNQL
jgi:hypothetical protein